MRTVSLLLGVAALTGVLPFAQANVERVDAAAMARIRHEALEASHVMEIVSDLADGIGPRLTGSPNLKRAQTYAIDRLRALHFDARVEPWGPFGRSWVLDDFSATMTSPDYVRLIAYPKAWSPSTAGTISGEPILLDARAPEDLAKYRGRLRGKIVLLTPPRALQSTPPPARLTDADLQRLAAPSPPRATAPITTPAQLPPAQRAAAAFTYERWKLLYDEGAAVVVEPGAGAGGTVYVTSASMPVPIDVEPASRPHPWDRGAIVLPQIVMAAEQYNRIARLAARGEHPALALRIAARFDDRDLMSGNVIGEFPGTDLKNEIVMIGGCLDSWHAGTGAVDNAAGAAVVLEAARILTTLERAPRRTIRVGLWSAEEQGHLGSNAYVAAHFGPEADRFSAYFNMDYGAGRIRGIYLQNNAAVRDIFRAWLAPFSDLGAATLVPGEIGATDHVPFDNAGLPAFQFLRDFMEGGGGVEHTNMDTYDHVLPDDVKQAAAILAAFAYDAAMRDQKLPRKAGR